MTIDVKREEELFRELTDPALADYPEKFVQLVYPWGKAGTELEYHAGPKKWQIDILQEIGAFVRENKERMALGLQPDTYRLAIAGGRGIGKTALYGMVAHWMMTVAPGCTIGVSANSEPQLRTKTFPELRKWFSKAINAHWFELGATAIKPAPAFAAGVSRKQEEGGLEFDPAYYYTQQWLWAEENPSGYVGAHSAKGMAILMDEAEGIPANIMDSADGVWTDYTAHKIWIMFSQARHNSGGFYERFHNPELKKFWRTRHINALEVEGISHEALHAIIAQHGADSDNARVEVFGQFPNAGQNQFIPNDLVYGAQRRELVTDPGAPLIMGVDVAREGNDMTVCRFRQGPDARSIPPIRWQIPDLTVTADRIADLIDEYKPDAVCIDWGMGVAVADMLKRKKYQIHVVNFANTSSTPGYANKRTEMYGLLKNWLPLGAVDDCAKLFGDLTAPTYEFKGKDNILLEPKPAYKKRLGRSPDDGDALALTFAVKASRRDGRTSRAPRHSQARDVDYPLFG